MTRTQLAALFTACCLAAIGTSFAVFVAIDGLIGPLEKLAARRSTR
jgi:hypothetical protein